MRISAAAVRSVIAHALTEPAREVCGVLIGDDEQRVVRQVREGANLAADPQRHFLLDATTLLHADTAARADGNVIVGFYHSHPAGPPVPSNEDRAATWPAIRMLIVGLHPAPAVALWDCRDGDIRPCLVEISDGV